MNLYELTTTYGKGKGEGMMWKTVEIISDAVEHSMPEEERHALVRKLYGEMSGGHYNEEFAMEDIARMYYTDKNDKKHYAPYWTVPTMEEVYAGIKGEIKAYNLYDFMVVLNMVASDNWCMYDRWFPEMTDGQRNAKLIDSAVNWLKDEDARHPDSKIWHYLND